MIQTRNIGKSYGEKWVLHDITLELPKNKLIAFIGSNGAGKSTAISIITRTMQKSSGDVLVDGQDLSQWKNKDLAKRLSILKQSNHLNIRLTVKELVSFGRFPYSGGKLTDMDKAKIHEAVAYMGLGELADRYLDELSGGQRQMAYIAMVIAQDTEYVFLDEPLNSLDMKHSVKIMQVLRRLVDELGKTVIVVIHDINFVSCYADYVVAMKNGEILEEGATAEIIRSDVLREIYDMDIQIEAYNDKRICVYYS